MIRYLRYFSHRLRQIQELVDGLAQLNTRLDQLEAGQKAVIAQIQSLAAEQKADLARTHAALDGELKAVQATTGETLARLNTAIDQDSDTQRLHRHALGRIELRQLEHTTGWEQQAVRIYSQFGEDGLLASLLRALPPTRRFFVEFGVEDYTEANTLWLLQQEHWEGLVLDGSVENITALRERLTYRRNALRAEAAFITRENINALLTELGVPSDLGVLSIDIDGNDYWVWEALSAVQPDIVMIEYNFRFGAEAAVVVPYAPDFVKHEAHPSALHYGASLAALAHLGKRKGYDLVGCSDGGANAFFVRSDKRPASIPARTPQDAFVAGTHDEWREPQPDGSYHLRKASFAEQHALVMGLPRVTISEESA